MIMAEEEEEVIILLAEMEDLVGLALQQLHAEDLGEYHCQGL